MCWFFSDRKQKCLIIFKCVSWRFIRHCAFKENLLYGLTMWLLSFDTFDRSHIFYKVICEIKSGEGAVNLNTSFFKGGAFSAFTFYTHGPLLRMLIAVMHIIMSFILMWVSVLQSANAEGELYR